MNNSFIRYLHKSYLPLFLILFLTLSVASIAALASAGNKLFVFFFTLALSFLVIEIAFRFAWRLFVGEEYVRIPKLPFEAMWVEPHPYMPYVNKKNAKTPEVSVANYPLHKGKYKFTQLKTNSSGFVNGPNGDRDVLVPKPEKLIRINCIGASTTGNYISENAEAFSYPMELEKILSSNFHEPIEVNNYGMGGYNSAEIMICFALRVIHTAPDFLIIYHAYNDIAAYLTSGFSSDYGHCRQNLSANYWKYKISSIVPQLNSKLLNYLVNRIIPSDIRNSLISAISMGVLDIEQDPTVGLQTYERNLQHIIDLCKCNGIQIILSTYAFYMYKGIANDKLHQLYESIVKRENDVMRGLAKKNDLPLIDNAKLIPSNQEYFVDSVHLTPKGMNKLASNISSVLMPMIMSTLDNK